MKAKSKKQSETKKQKSERLASEREQATLAETNRLREQREKWDREENERAARRSIEDAKAKDEAAKKIAEQIAAADILVDSITNDSEVQRDNALVLCSPHRTNQHEAGGFFQVIHVINLPELIGKVLSVANLRKLALDGVEVHVSTEFTVRSSVDFLMARAFQERL